MGRISPGPPRWPPEVEESLVTERSNLKPQTLSRRVRDGITQRQVEDRLLDVIATMKVDGLLKKIIKEESKVGLEFNYLGMIIFVMSPSCPATNWPSRRGTSCDDLGMPSRNRRNPSHGPRRTKRTLNGRGTRMDWAGYRAWKESRTWTKPRIPKVTKIQNKQDRG